MWQNVFEEDKQFFEDDHIFIDWQKNKS